VKRPGSSCPSLDNAANCLPRLVAT
jgi:hypothetical protein